MKVQINLEIKTTHSPLDVEKAILRGLHYGLDVKRICAPKDVKSVVIEPVNSFKVKVQVKESNIYWENMPFKELPFNTWKEVSKFAYSLALFNNKEVRVEYKGNGHYYNPYSAENYLKQ